MNEVAVTVSVSRSGQISIQSPLLPPVAASILRKALTILDEHSFAATVQQMQSIQVASQIPDLPFGR
jgi:hypothetical protein